MARSMSEARREVLRKKGVKLAPRTKQTITQDEVQADYHKTDLMKYIELKYSKPIDKIIYEGGVDHVAKKYSIDRSTVSKWRKRISRDKFDAEAKRFFERFEL